MNTTPTPIPQTNIMLDIETLGLKPGSVIKSIGAVKFGDGKITDRFYTRIDAQNCMDLGLVVDMSTVEWWLGQSDEARKEMTLPGMNLYTATIQFSDWIDNKEAYVWGNGSAYDNVLLAVAAERVGVPMHWAHKHSLCYRTVKNANRDIPIDPYRVRTHHNALDDAESQALHLMAIWERDAKRVKALELLKSALPGLRYITSSALDQPQIATESFGAWDKWFEDACKLIS